jgi:hypothetical protein
VIRAATDEYIRLEKDWRDAQTRDRVGCPFNTTAGVYYCRYHFKICPESPETKRLEKAVRRAGVQLRRVERERTKGDPPAVSGVYLMQDGDHFKIGLSGNVRSRLQAVRGNFADTEMHSFVELPEDALTFVESELLAWAYKNYPRTGCRRCAAGDWFCFDEAGVQGVQQMMMNFSDAGYRNNAMFASFVAFRTEADPSTNLTLETAPGGGGQ